MQEQPFDRAVTAKERYRHTNAGKQPTGQTVTRGRPSFYRLRLDTFPSIKGWMRVDRGMTLRFVREP